MSRDSRHRGAAGPDPRRDVDEEIAFHLAMRERELVEQGETPERARELALQRFGDVEPPREECVQITERHVRRAARREVAAELLQDVVYALRALRRRPGFALVAVLTLGLGIGANSAIFSVVRGVLLESLPFAHAERLYVAEMVYPDGARYAALSAPDYMSVAAQTRAFDRVGAFEAGRFAMQGVGDPREVRGARTSDGLLRMLGLGLSLGRDFAAEDHQPGAGDKLVLAHGFWQRELGGAPDVLGRRVTVAGNEYTVVGVLAPGANLPFPVDVLAPIEYGEEYSASAAAGRRSEFLSVIGRARPGVNAEQVDEDLARIAAQLGEEFPATNERLSMAAVPLRDTLVGDMRRPLLVLLGAVGLVLLIACANVANLLLARASSRQDELAVRAALGAGRARLVRQLVTESLVLGVLGGALGLLLAWWGTRALVAAQPVGIPRLEHIGVNGTVVFVTLGLSLLTGLLFGALPAVHATRGNVAQPLREAGRGQGPGGQRARAALVVAEMALAVVLLIGAGLLIRSFIEMTRVHPGFESGRALAFRVVMERDRYPEGQHVRDFTASLLERLEAMPGVTSAAATTVLPLRGLGALYYFEVLDAPPPPESVNREIAVASVTPGYFTAIGASVVRGRDLASTDRADTPPVALINEAAARFWFPGEDPVGRRVDVNGEREIVGVVSDVLQRDARTPIRPQLFAPHQQRASRTINVIVRTAGEPLALAAPLRDVLRATDPTMPIGEFTPLQRVVADSVARPRFYTALLTLFAGIALLLAAIGVFGVMSYSVAQRTREISIRMALGARATQVIALVVGRSMLLAAAGLGLGIVGAIALGRVLRSQLYNVTVTDPVTLAAVALVLGACALAASYLPARRAASLDPGMALRK